MERVTEELAFGALMRVQDRDTRRVRVEDYVAVIAAMTGEAVLVSAEILDIVKTDLAPGSPVYSDRINAILTGDTADLAMVPPTSVVGLLRAALVPGTVTDAAFADLEGIYRGVAAGVGQMQWGMVPSGLDPEHAPSIVPLRVAYEMRNVVDAAANKLRLPQSERYVPCAMALARVLEEVRESIDPNVAVRLALEVVFGTAKMVPVSRRVLASAKGSWERLAAGE